MASELQEAIERLTNEIENLSGEISQAGSAGGGFLPGGGGGQGPQAGGGSAAIAAQSAGGSRLRALSSLAKGGVGAVAGFGLAAAGAGAQSAARGGNFTAGAEAFGLRAVAATPILGEASGVAQLAEANKAAASSVESLLSDYVAAGGNPDNQTLKALLQSSEGPERRLAAFRRRIANLSEENLAAGFRQSREGANATVSGDVAGTIQDAPQFIRDSLGTALKFWGDQISGVFSSK